MNILTRMRGQAPVGDGAGRLGRSLRSRVPLFFGAALLLFLALPCFYTVDTGAVGVEKTPSTSPT